MGDSPAFHPAVPHTLGKYEVRRLLGKGSMGMVFLGYDPGLERHVAIKIMGSASVSDARMRERFEREAKAVARLKHPNIVTVHDLGYAQDGLPFIAMEFLEGSDLDELIEAGPEALSRRLDIMVQVCRGIDHAHQNGVIHRDIKPANIFVTTTGTAKVMDFGVARWTPYSQTQSGLVVGTAGYIAPEQLRGERADARADVFSLGVVLFELLTGRHLFEGDSLEAIFFVTLTKKTPVLTARDGIVPPGLQEILSRSVAKNPEKRYQTTAELAEAIQAFSAEHALTLPAHVVFDTREADDGPRPTSPRATLRLPQTTELPLVSSPPTERPRRPPRPSAPVVPRRRWVPIAALATLAAVLATFALLYRPAAEGPRTHASAPLRVSEPAPMTPHDAAPIESEPLPAPVKPVPNLVADAALALSQGKLREAEAIIARGAETTPHDPRWSDVKNELRDKRARVAARSRVTQLVRDGRAFLQAQDYASAIEAFRVALQHDASNDEASRGLDQAIASERALREEVRPVRRIVESRTVFIPGSAQSPELLGFEREPGLAIKETADPSFPAQLIIELDPVDAKPGEPYSLRVKIYNEGYRVLELSSLEIVSRFEGMTTGKGLAIPVRDPLVPPQSTVLVHEIAGIWKEVQNQAELEATVWLANGDRLTKRLSW